MRSFYHFSSSLDKASLISRRSKIRARVAWAERLAWHITTDRFLAPVLDINMSSAWISIPVLNSSVDHPGPSRISSPLSPRIAPESPPPHRNRPKSSLFARLRRTAIPIPMSVASHLALADTFVSTSRPKWDKRASKKGPAPLPPSSESIAGFYKDELTDEIEWNRLRSLPRVRLIPPEEGNSFGPSRRRVEIDDV